MVTLLKTALKVADEVWIATAILHRAHPSRLEFSVNEIVEVLNDPHVKFTTTPENVMKYATFMHDVGSIKNRPSSWKDLFFPEIQGAPGS